MNPKNQPCELCGHITEYQSPRDDKYIQHCDKINLTLCKECIEFGNPDFKNNEGVNIMTIKKPLAILNTSILTSEGTFTLKLISLEDAKNLVNSNEILSAVGHQSTAEILTELLEVSIPVNRIQFEQQEEQKALVFKLNGRAPEGKILSREEIEAIGYKFQLLKRIDESQITEEEGYNRTLEECVEEYLKENENIEDWELIDDYRTHIRESEEIGCSDSSNEYHLREADILLEVIKRKGIEI